MALALITGCEPEPFPAASDDAWLGEDKFRHFALSFAATQMAYAGARFVAEPATALPTAAGTALALGLGKEIADLRAGGSFSFKDLAWDAAGVALGLVIVRNTR